MKIYLDNCCFNRPFDDQGQLRIRLETEAKLHIQQKILDGDFELVWSYILEFENNQNPFDDRYYSIKGWKDVSVVHCIENNDVIKIAEKLKKKGVRTKDSLHIACAVYSGVKYFITADKKLCNLKIKEIEIINPLEFIDKLEK